jgi:hypothetical protein
LSNFATRATAEDEDHLLRTTTTQASAQVEPRTNITDTIAQPIPIIVALFKINIVRVFFISSTPEPHRTPNVAA